MPRSATTITFDTVIEREIKLKVEVEVDTSGPATTSEVVSATDESGRQWEPTSLEHQCWADEALELLRAQIEDARETAREAQREDR